ncbi:unnamed protein product [Hyaloperonospora brassicae]|uniref:U2A'/phosphoprotein 32 family A C-terminal domain-containing protein n=1 Tax=Hyaloperonospora brassicae TaxID=162125 RepID=A0AAV0THC0_HYABA|nr:unnamed protein product [Hyaloperonospora brassicae]
MVHTTERNQAPAKGRIKKLTAEKLEHFRSEIITPNGLQVDLSGRGIETIVSLEGLETATKLDLSHNKLTKLSQLKAVAQVTMLKLTDNKLTGDGLAEIQHLKKLVILNAADNNVTRIPFEVLRNVRTLKALVLNNNSISTLDWIPKLPELNSLIVSNNRIAQIPQRVLGGLPNLKKISISHNLLEEIPNLSHLSQITELRLSHNRIKTVPAHLAQLKNLKVLELSHNEIDDWSGLEALSALDNLRQLNLIGNPIVGKKLPTVAGDVKKSGDACNSDSDNGDRPGDSNNQSGRDSDSREKKKNETEADKADASDDEKQRTKEDRRLDAKHKQYNFKMKRLFPNLVVRDATRVQDKRVHGYVAPPKEEKTTQDKHKKGPAGKHANTTCTGKRKRGEASTNVKTEAKAFQTTACVDSNKSVENSSKKERKKEKMRKERKSGEQNARAVAKPSAALPESDKAVKHKNTKAVKSNDIVPTHIAPSASVSNVKEQMETKAVKEKKQKTKKKKEQDKKKDQRQPKEIASGVVAAKQFKKAKKGTSQQAERLDLTQMNFAPNIGSGGSSAWD